MTPDRSRVRTVLQVLGLLAAGVAFAAALAVLTTHIASPRIGLSGTPSLGELSPATTTRDTTTPRTTSTARTTTDEGRPATTPTPAPTAGPDEDDGSDDDVDDDDSGQGRGRGRGRGGDDDD